MPSCLTACLQVVSVSVAKEQSLFSSLDGLEKNCSHYICKMRVLWGVSPFILAESGHDGTLMTLTVFLAFPYAKAVCYAAVNLCSAHYFRRRRVDHAIVPYRCHAFYRSAFVQKKQLSSTVDKGVAYNRIVQRLSRMVVHDVRKPRIPRRPHAICVVESKRLFLEIPARSLGIPALPYHSPAVD